VVGDACGTPVGEQRPAGEHSHGTVSRPLTVLDVVDRPWDAKLHQEQPGPPAGVADLRGWTDNWIDNRNEHPHPSVRRMTADEILETIATYLQRIPHSEHWRSGADGYGSRCWGRCRRWCCSPRPWRVLGLRPRPTVPEDSHSSPPSVRPPQPV